MSHVKASAFVLLLVLVLGSTPTRAEGPDETAGYSCDFHSDQGLTLDGTAMVRRFHPVATQPEVKVSWKDPSYRKWQGKDAGFGYFGNVVRLADGTLFARFQEQPPIGVHQARDYKRTVTTRSTDGGKTWEKPIPLFDPAGKNEHVWPLALSDGSVVIGRVEGEDGKRWLMRSTDAGRTFENWVEIPKKLHAYRPMLEMSNGEILFLSAGWDDMGYGRGAAILNPTTKSWQNFHTLAPLGYQQDEWWVTETRTPGHLVGLSRDQSDSNYFITFESDDYGRTWHGYRPSDVWFGQVPNCPCIVTLADGTVMALIGERTNYRITAMPSFDRGKTFDWSRRIVVCDSPNDYFGMRSDFAYPDGVPVGDGKWLVRYYVGQCNDDANKKFGVWANFIDTSYFSLPFEGVRIAMDERADVNARNAQWSFDGNDERAVHEPVGSSYGFLHGPKRDEGLFGKGVRFSRFNDRVTMVDNPAIRVGNRFTIECFIRLDEAGEEGKEYSIIAKRPYYWLLLKDGKVVYRQGPHKITDDAEPDVLELVSKTQLEPGKWHHVAVANRVYGWGYDYLTLCVDGKKETEIRITPQMLGQSGMTGGSDARYCVDWKIDSGPMFVQTPRFYEDLTSFGAIKEAPAFKGVLDEVVFHRRGLSREEIQRRAERGYPVATPVTVTSPMIRRPNWKAWDAFHYTADTPPGASVRVDIIDGSGQYEGGKVLIADAKDGQDLSGITKRGLQLRATLETKDKHVTPVLKNWSLSWK